MFNLMNELFTGADRKKIPLFIMSQFIKGLGKAKINSGI